MNTIEWLMAEIAPLRRLLSNHLLYDSIVNISDARMLMEYHVFVILNFMTLLQELQRRLILSPPIFPSKWHRLPNHLIREILISDHETEGRYNQMNYFDLYLHTMQEIGCDMSKIEQLLDQIKKGETLEEALIHCQVPPFASALILQTTNILKGKQLHIQLAAFIYGMEDPMLILLNGLLNRIKKRKLPGKTDLFRYCLRKGIIIFEPLPDDSSAEILEILCGEDERKWLQVVKAIKNMLNFQLELWNHLLTELVETPFNGTFEELK